MLPSLAFHKLLSSELLPLICYLLSPSIKLLSSELLPLICYLLSPSIKLLSSELLFPASNQVHLEIRAGRRRAGFTLSHLRSSMPVRVRLSLNVELRRPDLVLVMNDNAAAAEDSGRVSLIAAPQLVVVDQSSAAFVPDLDAEFVWTTAPVDPAVNCTDDKGVVAAAVYPATAFVIRFCASNQHPVVACAVKIDAAHFELKLCLSGWHISPVLIPRNKPERGLSGQQRIRSISAGWRVDPSAAGYPLAALVRNQLAEFLNAYACDVSGFSGAGVTPTKNRRHSRMVIV